MAGSGDSTFFWHLGQYQGPLGGVLSGGWRQPGWKARGQLWQGCSSPSSWQTAQRSSRSSSSCTHRKANQSAALGSGGGRRQEVKELSSAPALLVGPTFQQTSSESSVQMKQSIG